MNRVEKFNNCVAARKFDITECNDRWQQTFVMSCDKKGIPGKSTKFNDILMQGIILLNERLKFMATRNANQQKEKDITSC